MDALGINLGYLVVQILNFLILLVVLHAWVYRPVVELLERRRETIAKGLEDARVAAEARENAEAEAENILAKAQQEASQVVREASQRAETAGQEIKAEAEKDAEQIRKGAMAEAESTREEALSELRGQVAMLAIAAAEKVIGQVLDEQRQHSLIDEFFSGVKGGNVQLLETESLTGGSAEITSALPLTDAEKETVRNEVLSKLGGSATISFRVDPEILGGLVVRVGDKVVDGSVAGKLSGLRQSIG